MYILHVTNLRLSEEQQSLIDSNREQYIGLVSSQFKGLYKVISEVEEMTAEVSGKFRYKASSTTDFPAVGDYVLLDRNNGQKGHAVILQVLPRKSVFIRKIAGTKTDAQIVATNIDIIMICMSLNQDYNLRRLERYLTIAWDSGATPVIVLTKSDLCKDVASILHEISAIAVGVDIIVTSSISEEGYELLRKYITPGKAVTFIGSSGVGKSTIINQLLGQEVLTTADIRNDDKGRHTTTRRELFILPNGGIVIDTPGMRELGVISGDVTKSFADIEELANQCKFRNCSHEHEHGCAVQEAIIKGDLTAERLKNYNKIAKEMKYENLHSKEIEKEKIQSMFGSMGSMKQMRKMVKEKNKSKYRK